MITKIMHKLKKTFTKKPSKKRKKDIFDLSARDLGRATKKLFKRVVVKGIREW